MTVKPRHLLDKTLSRESGSIIFGTVMLTIFVLFLFFIVKIPKSPTCPNKVWKSFRYGERIVVLKGFHEGRVGTVSEIAEIRNRTCPLAGFGVLLDKYNKLPAKEIIIDQDYIGFELETVQAEKTPQQIPVNEVQQDTASDMAVNEILEGRMNMRAH